MICKLMHVICKHFANDIFFQPAWAYFSSQLSDYTYMNHSFTFNHLFVHSQTILCTAMYQQQFNISHLFAHI